MLVVVVVVVLVMDLEEEDWGRGLVLVVFVGEWEAPFFFPFFPSGADGLGQVFQSSTK